MVSWNTSHIFMNFGRRSAMPSHWAGIRLHRSFCCGNWSQAEASHSPVHVRCLFEVSGATHGEQSARQCLGLHLQQISAIWKELCIRHIEFVCVRAEDWYGVWGAWLEWRVGVWKMQEWKQHWVMVKRRTQHFSSWGMQLQRQEKRLLNWYTLFSLLLG